MSKKNKIFISCDDANHSCDKNQYNEATLLEKIKLTIHLIYCRACRKYSSSNGKLTKVISKSNVDCLDLNGKQKMKDNFETELKKHQN